MVKPTLWQSVFNLPTQSYTFPPLKKDYHSQKNDFVRIAQDYMIENPAQLVGTQRKARSSTFATLSLQGAGESPGRSSSSSNIAPAKSLKVTVDRSTNDTPPNDQQFMRTNIMSSNATTRDDQSPMLRPRDHEKTFTTNNDSDSDSDSQEDVFYTPNTSPRTSMVSQSPQNLTSLIPFPTPPPRTTPLVRQGSADSMTSTTATTSAADVADLDSVSADGSSYSLFSLPTNSDSTWNTTPVTSDAGHHPKTNNKRPISPSKFGPGVALDDSQSNVTYHNLGSSSSQATLTSGPSPRRSANSPIRAKKTSTTNIRMNHVPATENDDWAKDVRWLTAPPLRAKSKSDLSSSSGSVTSSSASRRVANPNISSTSNLSSAPATLSGRKTLRHRRSKSLIIGSPRPLESHTHTQPELHLQQSTSPRQLQHRRSKSASARKAKAVMSMSALVEVEEPSEANELHQALMGRDRSRTHSLLQTPSKNQLRPQSSRSRVSSSPSTPTQNLPSHPAPPRSQYTNSSRTVALPTPLPVSSSASTSANNLPSNGTPGFTSLVLPRAAYRSSSKSKVRSKLGFGFGALGGGEVDLTKGGMAQTTMATVEVVRGIAKANTSSSSAAKSARRKVLPMSFIIPSFISKSPSRKGKEKAVDDSPLTFTSWRKPPGYVGTTGVLVQVWAAAIDGVDQTLVSGASPSQSLTISRMKGGSKDGELTKKADVGFIPGRSFVGRVLECGYEVGEEIMKRTDWVVGLLDVKKCGALAEFIVVDRRRLHRVPYPRMPSNNANSDIHSHAHALTLEELALLPLAGIPAHRAVRTFMPVEADAAIPPRVLVLRGQEGAGAMAVQMLARRGWRVSVHVPVPIRFPTVVGHSLSYASEESGRTEYLDETEDTIRAWGAEEVFFDDDPEGRDGAIKLMQRLLEEGEVFDAVLDTVGGKDIWYTGEALLAGHGRNREAQFTTLMGDQPERIIPSTSDLFKSGVRSAKKHGSGGAAAVHRRLSVDSLAIDGRKTKLKGKVGYAWVIINQGVDWEGEDIAESLRVVIRSAVTQDGIRPRVVDDKIIPFEKTPDIFVGENLGSGGTFVVKVVG